MNFDEWWRERTYDISEAADYEWLAHDAWKASRSEFTIKDLKEPCGELKDIFPLMACILHDMEWQCPKCLRVMSGTEALSHLCK